MSIDDHSSSLDYRSGIRIPDEKAMRIKRHRFFSFLAMRTTKLQKAVNR